MSDHFLPKRIIALYSENATFSIDFNNKSKALHLEPESTNIYFYINKNLNNKTDNLQLDKVDGIPDISLNREELIALLKPQIYYRMLYHLDIGCILLRRHVSFPLLFRFLYHPSGFFQEQILWAYPEKYLFCMIALTGAVYDTCLVIRN